MSESSAAPKKKKAKAKNKGKRKAPGLLSFVVWRQFFMVLGAPGIATAFAALYDAQDSFIGILIAVAVPSLIHGQLWKWTYDWAGRGEPTMRNLRIGQIVLGMVHSALCSFALLQVATGAINFADASFYHGLTIAGLVAGVWETIRPGLELKDPPEVKEREARKAARRAAKKKQALKEKAEAATVSEEDEQEEEPATDPAADRAAAEAQAASHSEGEGEGSDKS